MESDLNLLRSIISDNSIRINKLNTPRGVSLNLKNTKLVDKKGHGSTFTQDSMWEISFCILPYICHEFILGKGESSDDYSVVCNSSDYSDINKYLSMTSLYHELFSDINSIIESDLRIMKEFIKYIKCINTKSIGSVYWSQISVEYSSINRRNILMIYNNDNSSISSIFPGLTDEISSELNKLLLPWNIIFTSTRIDTLNEMTSNTNILFSHRSFSSDLFIMNRK